MSSTHRHAGGSVRRPSPGRAAGARERGARAPARDRLLDAACAVLREFGFRAAPLDEILKRSGVAKSNLYYHFPGKLELACAAVDRWRRDAEMLALQEMLTDERVTGLERIRAVFGAFETSSSMGPCGCPFGMLAAEDDLEEPLRLRVEAAFEAVRSGMLAALRAGQRDGSIRSDTDPESISLSLMALFQGGGLIGRAARDASRISASVEPVLSMLAGPKAGAAGAARTRRRS